MKRRFLVNVLIATLLALPFLQTSAFAAQTIDPVGVALQCNESGSAYLTVSNRTTSIRFVVVLTSLASTGNRVEASFEVEPLRRYEATAQRGAAPENGYHIGVYDHANGQVLLSETRDSGRCTSDDENTLVWDDNTYLTLTPTPDWSSALAPTTAPIPNSFRVTTASQDCSEQSFYTTWNGTNLASVQVNLSNSSENWSSGWISLDPNAGVATVSAAQTFDRADFSISFVDGSWDEEYFNMNPCTGAPGPTQPVVQPTDPAESTAPATEVPVENGFSLLAAQRMCSDQSFQATWSGTNIESLQFSLSNTSDDWTSGWFDVDAAAGSVSRPVDHHSYDKALASVVFADGSEDTVSVNVGTCTEAPAPPAPPPPATGGGSTVTVKSLPSTGTGNTSGLVMLLGSVTALAGAVIVAGSLRKRS